MKFGIHLSTYTKTWDEDVLGYIPVSKALGYDGVEFPLLDPENFEVEKAKKLLRKNELLCTCGTGLNPDRDIASSDKSIVENGIIHLQKCIDICHELETDCLGGVLYAPWGKCIPRAEFDENIKISLENLSKLGDYAKRKGVVIALEILNRYESSFMNTVDEGLERIQRVNHDHIKLHFDTFHANIEEKSIKEALIKGGKEIYHIHFCENDRGALGTGSLPWQEVKKGLELIGYDRWITLENFVMADCQIGNDVSIWRNLVENGHSAAEIGIEFMKKLFTIDG